MSDITEQRFYPLKNGKYLKITAIVMTNSQVLISPQTVDKTEVEATRKKYENYVSGESMVTEPGINTAVVIIDISGKESRIHREMYEKIIGIHYFWLGE